MDINYDLLDNKVKKTIENIENKPHVRYIRYLLMKRYSPTVIKSELSKLGLSAPHEKYLTVYYLAVLDPLIKKFGLGSSYASYKNKLLKTNNERGSFMKDLLLFRIEFGDSPDYQQKFCALIRELDIEDCWVPEILKYYGIAANVPLDNDGNRIIKSTSHRRTNEKVLTYDKRYLIEKMILEGVPDTRIAAYFREKEKFPLFDYDITYYKKVFFNMRTYSIEEKIHLLETEATSLKNYMEDVKRDIDIDLGEKVSITKQVEERIEEIKDNIKTMNMFFSEAAVRQMEQENQDFEALFLDVVNRGYTRFCQLDGYRDRDVVDPLVKVAKMMGYAHEKALEIQERKTTSKDKHSQGQIMELYRKRVDEAYSEQEAKDAENLNSISSEILEGMNDEILGLDELNVLREDKIIDEE